MTLAELENTLPNGLHDAEVQRLEVDYQQRKVRLELSVWDGDMNGRADRREAYKRGCLDITGLIFLVMEAPDPRYPFMNPGFTIDGCDMSKNVNAELMSSIPHDAFFRSLWVNEWNAFVHIAAKDARMEWLNGGAITYRTGQERRA